MQYADTGCVEPEMNVYQNFFMACGSVSRDYSSTYFGAPVVDQRTGEDIVGLDDLVLMPNKDGTGPKGNGKQDGSGGGNGNQGQGNGSNKGGSGQGSKTGGKKGGCD